jgi:transcription-repair coupling factor (superfamily II helicase)
MGWYSKFAQASTANGIDSLLDDFEGWFGEPPPEVRNVAGMAQVRILCRELGIQRCSWLKVRVLLEMHPSTSLTEEHLSAFERKHPKRVAIKRVEGAPTQLSVRFLSAEAQRPFQFMRWLFAGLQRTS